MAIMVTCGNCSKTLQAKDEWAGKNVKCPGCKEVMTVPSMKAKGSPPPMPAGALKSPARRPRDEEDEEPVSRRSERPVARRRNDDDDDRRGGRPEYDAREIKLTKWSPAFLFVPILNIVSLFKLILSHGSLPQVRDDDPSAGKALGFMFIPFFNIYWAFFVWLRLCDRLNEAREVVGQEPNLPRGLMKGALITQLVSIPLIFCGIGILGLAAAGVMQLIALFQIQSRINEIVDAVEEGA